MAKSVKPMITVTAKVYRQHGEVSDHALRAAVLDTGMKVSCPYEWRDAWSEGDQFQFVGVVVDQVGGKSYFKARAVAQQL